MKLAWLLPKILLEIIIIQLTGNKAKDIWITLGKKKQMREFLELEVSFTIILPSNLLTFLMASTPLP